MFEELRAVFGLRDEDEVVAIGVVFAIVLLAVIFFMRGCNVVEPFVGTDVDAVAALTFERPAANQPIVPARFTGGTIPFSGTYLPEKNLTLLLDGAVIGETRTDRSGQWGFTHRIDQAGHYNLLLRDENGAGAAVHSVVYPFAVERTGVIVAEVAPTVPAAALVHRGDSGSAVPTVAITITTTPEAVVIATKVARISPTPTILVVNPAVVPAEVPPTSVSIATPIPATAIPELTALPPTVVLPTAAPVVFSAEFSPLDITETAAGTPANIAMLLSGTGPTGATVQILHNAEAIDAVVIDDTGEWSYEIVQTLAPGGHVFGSVLLADNGNVAEEAPNKFTVSVESPPVVVADDGQLSVAYAAADAGGDESVTAGAPIVHFIFDASWSMRVALDADDTSRIGIAKEALRGVVDELPDGVPVSMRVFGNIEGNLACRTDLMRPVQPLGRVQFLAEIEEVAPIWNANTPIAASLAKVQEDLAGVSNPITVVLLTDGEETCDGDPAAEIQALQAAGFDVRVNVVGLKIDDDALKAEFARWAELGGGEYFDVSADPAELQQALITAMSVPYAVQAADGTLVASGIVGDEPLTLPSGEYTILIGNAEFSTIITLDETTQVVFGQ